MTKLHKKIAARHLNLELGFNAERVRTNYTVFAGSLLANTRVQVTKHKIRTICRRA